MRELTIPSDAKNDPKATEMIRFWLANGRPNVSLLIGMYRDAKDSDVDELWAWANILSDIAQHVANGLEREYGLDFGESMKQIAGDFMQCIKDRAPVLEGDLIRE